MFKHLFWVAPVTGIVLYVALHQGHETTTKIDVQSATVDRDFARVMAETTTDKKVKAEYKKDAEKASKQIEAAEKELAGAKETNSQDRKDMSEAMKEVDEAMKRAERSQK